MSGDGWSPLNDRGVSEIVGFVFVFAILVLSVSLVSIVGFQALEGPDTRPHDRAAAETMVELGSAIDEIVADDAVVERKRPLSTQDGRILPGASGSRLELVVESETETTRKRWDLGSVVYERDDDPIVYEGGAVVRGETVLIEPRFRCTAEIGLVSVPIVRSEHTGIQPDRSRAIRAIETDHRYRNTFDAVETVSLEFRSNSGGTAARNWEPIPGDEWETQGETGTVWQCGGDRKSIETRNVTVRVVEIELEV